MVSRPQRNFAPAELNDILRPPFKSLATKGVIIREQGMQALNVEGAGDAVADAAAKSCCICGVNVSRTERRKDSDGRYWCKHCAALDARPKAPGAKDVCAECGGVAPLVAEDGDQVCVDCQKIRQDEKVNFEQRRQEATDDLELARWRRIKLLSWGAAAFVGLAVVRLTVLRKGSAPIENWLNFSAVAALLIWAIYVRITITVRKKMRLHAYDLQIVNVNNALLALGEQNQSQSVVERTEPLRKQIERAVRRIEAAVGQGAYAGEQLVANFARRHNAQPVIEFLQSQRPGKHDLAARNREIETIAYLSGDWENAMQAIVAVLLLIANDFDALSRQALVFFVTGRMDEAKRNFARVINLAKIKGDQLELANAYSNLAMLHQLLEEIDDAEKRHTQALVIYRKMEGMEDRIADTYGNLGFIFTKRGEKKDAEHMFRKALEINTKLHRVEGLALCNGVLGLMIYQTDDGDLRQAERMLRRAANLNDTIGRFGAVAAAYGNLGLVRAKRHDLKNARQYLLKALGIYQRLNRQKMVVKVQGMLTQISKAAA